LASATAVDGHNWLYPVCVGVFDSETNENWVWVMSKLREVVGLPRGLAISMDVGQAMMNGVAEVHGFYGVAMASPRRRLVVRAISESRRPARHDFLAYGVAS